MTDCLQAGYSITTQSVITIIFLYLWYARFFFRLQSELGIFSVLAFDSQLGQSDRCCQLLNISPGISNHDLLRISIPRHKRSHFIGQSSVCFRCFPSTIRVVNNDVLDLLSHHTPQGQEYDGCLACRLFYV